MVQPRTEGRIELAASDDQAGALAGLVQDARQIVRIFSDHLSPQLFDNEELARELSRVARQGRPCEVRILIKNSQFLIKRSHRLGTLHQRLLSSVLLRKLLYCPDHYPVNYVLVDDCAIFLITNDDDNTCFLNSDDRPLVKHYSEQFDELWQKSSPDPDMRVMPM